MLTYVSLCGHVRNEYVREAKHRQISAGKIPVMSPQSRTCPENSPDETFDDITDFDNHYDIAVPPVLGFPTTLCISEYPIPMQPHTHQLLSNYMTHVTSRIFPIAGPLKFNPFKTQGWFQFAVTDAAMLHALLYAGAVYLALLNGKTESEDTVHHLSQTISIVSKRLSETEQVQDSTIGAISCLALGEVIRLPFQ
jgi:hypothetical protein